MSDTLESIAIDFTEEAPTDYFAPWVEWRREQCRGGRRLVTAVNTITDDVLHVDESDIAAALAGDTSRPGAADLCSGGFLAGASRPEASTPSHRPGDGIVWYGADRMARRLLGGPLAALFTRPGLLLQAAVGAIGILGFVSLASRRAVHWHASPWEVPVTFALGIIAMLVHESGHALVTVRRGRRVRVCGVVLHLGSPAFYVDSPDAVLLDRRHRLEQVVAGPWAEWLVTSMSIIVALLLPADSAAAQVLHRFAVVNTIGILTNLLPFVGLDGALILGDLVHEPDLAQRARRVFHRDGSALRRDPLLSIYAVANVAVGAVLLASSLWFWWLLFGESITMLWHAGPLGVALLCVIASIMNGRLHRLSPVALMVRRCRFRFERGWRVRATLAFRALPGLASCDESDLGIIAGKLRQVRPGELVPGPGHLFDRRGGVTLATSGERTDRRVVFLSADVMPQAA